jgi:hypothetical protein
MHAVAGCEDVDLVVAWALQPRVAVLVAGVPLSGAAGNPSSRGLLRYPRESRGASLAVTLGLAQTRVGR